jgi:hypothetical protein
MIGVIANSSDQEIVREFFELFKTPWEFYRRGRQYDILLCAEDGQIDEKAKLIVRYGGRKIHFDGEHKIQTGRQWNQARILSFQEGRLPLYGESITFPERLSGFLTDEDSRQSVAYLDRFEKGVVARIGYDLFDEIRTLLTLGQPHANANMPALELHIELLRGLITGCGLQLAEIPPVPDGYRFIACLTHDVDHPSIRQHKWDHTTFGFLYRAIFGSLQNLIRGRLPIRNLITNWVAALKLPFVHLGLAKDCWQKFDDRYLELEKGVCSTFFVIPFKDRPGETSHGPAPAFRAAQYGAHDIASTIQKLQTAGCEVGLHGIDAWRDSSRGSDELEEIRHLTGGAELGVRMHWLYYDQQSPVALEQAGAVYDSTIGYNETVGYRAGTLQVYKPIGANRLLELPLHVMDTALFYRAYLGLSPREARALVSQMVDNAVKFGGCLTINWHDRSVVPERLWDAFYRDLIQELKSRGAWLSTAGQAVSWFRKRRSAVFEADSVAPRGVRATVAADDGNDLPGLRLRIHKERTSGESGGNSSEDYFDIAFIEDVNAAVPCAAWC